MRNLGSLRLPSLATRVATAADGSRIAWDRVIVWSLAAQRQLRDGSTRSLPLTRVREAWFRAD